MPNMMDGTLLLLVVVAYMGLVANLNIINSARFILYLPVPIFLAIYLIYAIRAKTTSA